MAHLDFSPASSSARLELEDEDDNEDDGGSDSGQGGQNGSSRAQEKKPRKRRKVVNTDGEKKMHACTWPGCDKSFSRQDHLSRHKLNHAPTQIYNCDRCSKVFVRADLLVRHTERHEKRESLLESGAANSLTTNLRKPVVKRNVNQNHVNPTDLTLSGAGGAGGGQGQNFGTPPADLWSNQQQNQFFGYNPSSNPGPTPSTSSATDYAALHHQQQHAKNVNAYGSFGLDNTYSNPLLSTFSSDAMQSNAANFFDSYPSTSSHLPGFEEPLSFIQQSYGAPFVSGAEYQWLFSADGGLDVTLSHSRPASPGREFDESGQSGNGLSPDVPDLNRSLAEASAELNSFSSSSRRNEFDPVIERDLVTAKEQDEWRNSVGMKGQTTRNIEAEEEAEGAANEQGLPRGSGMKAEALGPTTGAFGFKPTVSFKDDVAEEGEEDGEDEDEEEEEREGDHEHGAEVQEDEAEGRNATPPELSDDPSTSVDAKTRRRILDYLGPEWKHLYDDERMTVKALQRYLYLFWTRVHETQAPAVHRATFRAQKAQTPLVLAMVFLGCFFAESESHQLAARLHPSFRGKVFCSSDFRPRAELWLHQTALLIIVFGKLCSNRMAHEMAHIFWSSVVTLGRRSAIFSPRPVVVPQELRDDPEALWAAWIEEEVSKRIAHIGFAVDVEHAALFRHSPTLSAFQIQLTLPCDEEEWEATNAFDWVRIHARSRPPVPFISALKASLMVGATPPVLNPFSRIAILHGLLSVAQDLQWRDHVIGLSQPEGRAGNWRDMVSGAYNNWKQRLDTCLMSASDTTSQLLRASISLYAVAHITLSIDIHELQIFAGAENALGLVVSQQVFEATATRIRMWAATKDGRAACWHSAYFLRSSLQHYFQSTGDLAGCLHHRWAVYIACLTLYCFGICTDGKPGPLEPDHQDTAIRYLDSMCTDTPEGLLDVPNKNNVLSLVKTILNYIQGSRWEIAQEGARMLRRLCTQGEKQAGKRSA